jgi:dihydrofolate reductase
MSNVVVDITMSLDGFVTGPGDDPGRGLGEGGEVLHYWVFGRPWSYGEPPGAMEPTGPDKEALDEAYDSGADVVGRRMYDVAGGWGGSTPEGRTCVVVTHRVNEQPDPASGYIFVEGVETAVATAQERAGDRRVHVSGGASVIQQAFKAGLVDELHLHIAPVILGGGRPLFGELGRAYRLERIRILDSSFATHISYRVLKD